MLLVVKSFLSPLWFSLLRLSPPDALLADLENTGSPLARCPVLLTSDPPQNADATEDAAPARPPPPAYTPQQVDDQLQGMDSDSPVLIWSKQPKLCYKYSLWLLLYYLQWKYWLIARLLCLSDGFCRHEIHPELQPRQIIQVTPSLILKCLCLVPDLWTAENTQFIYIRTYILKMSEVKWNGRTDYHTVHFKWKYSTFYSTFMW